MTEPRTLADDLAAENEMLRRRMIHHTRPKRPLTLDEARQLCEAMSGNGEQSPTDLKEE